MNKSKRSVLYAGGLQFCIPGLGRMYLRDWGKGIFQLLTSVIIVGLIWSWIDGYLIITRQHEIKNSKVNLIYHELSSDQNQKKSPLIAAVLQLFVLGLGRLYLGFLSIGLVQIAIVYFFLNGNFFSRICGKYINDYDKIRDYISQIPFEFFAQTYILNAFIQLLLVLWKVFDAYCILKGSQVNSDKRPLNYSVAMTFNRFKIGSRDKFIAGMLQLAFPGLGRCYMGCWLGGILQFLTSFVLIGTYWSWIDGHHIMLNSDVDTDGEGNSLTDQYRLNIQETC